MIPGGTNTSQCPTAKIPEIIDFILNLSYYDHNINLNKITVIFLNVILGSSTVTLHSSSQFTHWQNTL